MPGFQTVTSKVVSADLARGPVLARRGSMLCYTGDVRFRPVGGLGGGGGLGGLGAMAGRMLAGEHVAMMVGEGQGTVSYGYLGSHVTIVELTGELLQVEAARLLCHDATLSSSIVVLGGGGIRQAVRGAVSGQGLATTQLSGVGSVALLSHGPAFALQVAPGRTVAVDPQSYVAAHGALTVDVAASVGWRDAVGRGSGEAIQLRVTGQGTVYVQPSERTT